ncbi:hypothetical protein TNIN_281751 [Trichonephila inaurata madagascariensis]|uniref:Uncharacterized protein n=1 Tax=Trichonephila inaurata madagascariensis TaxID=2747483 RepID=A0A8X6YSK1_9ARAC|nr:hypothetical protein TNIN_281751 [Trichonephila inaurata madagascariensis]
MDQQDYETSDMDLVNSPHGLPLMLLSACELILQNKAQLQKMETFKEIQNSCIWELESHVDHHQTSPSTDVPLRAQEIEGNHQRLIAISENFAGSQKRYSRSYPQISLGHWLKMLPPIRVTFSRFSHQ